MTTDSKKPTSKLLVKTTSERGRKVTFGSVTIRTRPLEAKQIRENVASGQSALERARDSLLSSGVRLAPRKDVPLYHVDPDRPAEMIRRLDGRSERGTLVNGEFKVKS